MFPFFLNIKSRCIIHNSIKCFSIYLCMKLIYVISVKLGLFQFPIFIVNSRYFIHDSLTSLLSACQFNVVKQLSSHIAHFKIKIGSVSNSSWTPTTKHYYVRKELGPVVSIYRRSFQVWDYHYKNKTAMWPYNFKMRIPILIRRHIYTETPPWLR